MLTQIMDGKQTPPFEEVISTYGELNPKTKEDANRLANKILDNFNSNRKPNEFHRRILDIMAIYWDPTWVYKYYDYELEEKITKVSIFTGKR
jgi:hypothetical protein